ncbi:hypothetical protein H4R35_002806 [Dimargaris xerosporica]|nr:hypothetical protein H4R35_002806 [Dimargaris xerosporica]
MAVLSRKGWLVRAAVLLASLWAVAATPAFHTVNDYDLNGETCPLVTRTGAACPLLCVRDVAQCPDSLRPNCPSDQQLCGDGACHRSCQGIKNGCNCGGETYPFGPALVPCKAVDPVDIPYFNPDNKTAQTNTACAESVDLDPTLYGAWGDAENDRGIWASCPIKGVPHSYTFGEPMWIAIWSILGAEAFLLISWLLFKLSYEKAFRRPLADDFSSGVGSPKRRASDEKGSSPGLKAVHVDTEEGLDDFTMKGFKNSLYGTLGFYSVLAMCVGWIVFLAVLTSDYYGKVTGEEFGIAKGDSALSGKLFIVVWYFTVVWLLANNIFRSRVRNFFRLQCLPQDGHVVQVEKKMEHTLLLDDNSRLLDLVQLIESRLRRYLGWDMHVSTCPISRTGKGRLYFSYQCTLFVFDDIRARFAPFDIDLGKSQRDLMALRDGISQVEAEYRRELVGRNFISVYVPPFIVAVAQEFMGFFYLYQIMILWLFYYFAYYQVGLVDTGVILISALVKVVIRIKSETRLKEMAEHEDQVSVLRDGEWKNLSTADLVPGDVFEVIKGITVPCDAVVLSGNIVVDESSLTGEPLPIRKFPLRDDGGMYDISGSSKINSLYSGTTISQASPLEKGQPVTALVFRTGTATDKGQLVRNILFPNPVSFIFNEQLKIVIVMLLIYGLFLFAMALWWMNDDFVASWFYGMFCISQIISPLLPAALVVGQSMAAGRLRHKHIYCVDLPRIIIAGKVQIFCFDKTGTLTKEGLEFYGAKGVAALNQGPIGHTTPVIAPLDDAQGAPSFGARKEAFQDIPTLMRMGIACAHTVTEIEDQLIGNPVDIEMFRSTQWEICEPESAEYVDTYRPAAADSSDAPIHVVKKFEFIHARMSMSVAVLDSVTGHVHIFVKGSFEKLKELANSDSFPADYDHVTSDLAREGCYVLSMAHRDLGKVNLEDIRRTTREELEKDVDFIGLILFRNNLKPDTPEAIAELKAGNTRTVMITGDTALTGVYIARACGLAPPNDRILLGDTDKDGQLFWTDVDSKSVVPSVNDALTQQTADRGMELAVTGKAFRALINNEQIRSYLLDTRIFARMTPQDKVDCVQLHMERGITAMCGDGGNDCGALRAAHVGLALSEAEASIVSPFSTNVRSIFSCVELLRQGRGAIATSIANYKYLILYGQIMACLKLMGFYFSTQISQPLWIMIDAFITVGMAVAVTLAGPTKRLAPCRPTARLLGPQTLISTIGQVAINWIFVMGGYALLFSQDWFVCHEFDSRMVDLSKWWLLADSFEAETLSFIVLFQFINAGAVFNFGHMFRRAWWRNYALVFIWAGLLVIVSYVELADPNWLGCKFRLNCGDPDVLVDMGYPRPSFDIESYNTMTHHNVLPRSFRFTLWGYSIANMVAVALWEYFVVLGPVREWAKKKHPLPRLECKQ